MHQTDVAATSRKLEVQQGYCSCFQDGETGPTLEEIRWFMVTCVCVRFKLSNDASNGGSSEKIKIKSLGGGSCRYEA